MSKILSTYLKVLLVLFPVAYLPVITDMYGAGKIWWWLVLAVVGLIGWGVDLVVNRREEVKMDGVMGVLAVMGLWALVSWLKMPVGVRERTLWSPTGLATIWSLFVWYFLFLQAEFKNNAWVKWLRAAGIAAAVGSLVVFLIPEKQLPIVWPKDNPILVISQAWSLTGVVLGEMVLLAYLIALGAKDVMVKMKKNVGYTMDAAVTAVMGLGLALDIYRTSRIGWGLMNLNTAWSIAVEAFKRSPLWGVGSGNFVEAFNLFRPASYNLTKVWSATMNMSSMNWLQLWTELGIVGLLVMVLLVNQVLRTKEKNFGFWMALAAVISWLVLPFNLMGTLVMVLALTQIARVKKVKLMMAVGESNFNLMPYIVLLAIVGTSGFSMYRAARYVVGENYLRQSMVAASKNDGSKTYEWQNKLVKFDPVMADYRKAFSQTTMALAQNILTNKDLSDADKQKVSALLQLSIQEGKAAVALDNTNSTYWSNLAVLYKSIAGVVDGSADWSVQAYQQAILLDPVNPLLGLDYGGLLYAAGDYQGADRVFEQVVTNKPDFANAWYNWAYSAKKLNRLGDAVNRLSQSVALVPATTGDYDKATGELDTWKKEYDEAVKKAQDAQKATQTSADTQKAPETLKTPEALPTVGKEERVNVPASELEPPAVSPTQVPVKPTVVPTISPATTPSQTP